MESKITVNGVDYDRVEDMPAEVREVYEKALGNVRPQLSGLNVNLAEHHSVQRDGGAVKQTFIVNGKTYDDIDSVPADVRAAYDKAMDMLSSGDPSVTKNIVKLAFELEGPHFKFQKKFGAPSGSESVPTPPTVSGVPSPIEPAAFLSGFRLLFLLGVFLAGGGLVWLWMRGR